MENVVIPWWGNILISFAVSILTIIVSAIVTSFINRNKKLKFFIKDSIIYDSGYFQFGIVILNPAKIPQCYDTLRLSYFSGRKKLGQTQLETPDKENRTRYNELQTVYVPATTLQPKSIIELKVSGINKLILNSNKIKIEYYNIAKFFKKNQLISVKVLNKENVKMILHNTKQAYN